MDDFIYNTLREKILNLLKQKIDRDIHCTKSSKISNDKKDCRYFVFDLGKIGYEKAFDLQLDIFEIIKQAGSGGAILLLEHFPVITTGSNSKMDNVIAGRDSLKKQNIELVQSNRGGDVTFHGPGQIVCYPIFNLKDFGLDLTLFVYNLEEVIIRVLEKYNIEGFRIEKLRGVFTEAGKIASIGLRVKKWVTLHGFSLNVNVDLDYFKNIIACGLKDYRQTSVDEILKRDIELSEIKDHIIKCLMEVFKIRIYKITEI